MIDDVLATFPVVAILRGVRSEEVSEIGLVLYEAGVRCIEVPLNSPGPFDSIRNLADSMPDDCLVGAGTVLTADDVVRVRQSGGALIVTPNIDTAVIEKALAEDMQIAPGFATASEAFSAIARGVRVLKLFPASTYGSGHVKALRAVMPSDVSILAVGGIGADDFPEWLDAGVAGFGIGSELYRAGDTADQVKTKALQFQAAMASSQ